MKNLAYNCMIHIPQNQKLLAAVYGQEEVLFHQGERRVCHNEIHFLVLVQIIGKGGGVCFAEIMGNAANSCSFCKAARCLAHSPDQ